MLFASKLDKFFLKLDLTNKSWTILIYALILHVREKLIFDFFSPLGEAR